MLESRSMEQQARGRLASILTDIHFWVPVAVLLGGLLLLHAIHG
jgi:hypothetical protein